MKRGEITYAVRDPAQLRQAFVERDLRFREVSVLVGVSAAFLSHLMPPKNDLTKPPRARSCTKTTACKLARVLHRDVNELFEPRLPGRRRDEESTSDTEAEPTKQEKPDDGRTVYFVRAATGDVKIGVAGDIKKRLASLQATSPIPLALMGVIFGVGKRAEAELHERFAHLRRHGEWFEPTDDLLEYIRTHVDLIAPERNGSGEGLFRMPLPNIGDVRNDHQETTMAGLS